MQTTTVRVRTILVMKLSHHIYGHTITTYTTIIILHKNNTSNHTVLRTILVGNEKLTHHNIYYMGTLHDNSLHINNVCVAIKDIGFGYNNLYITMKKLYTRCIYSQTLCILEDMHGIEGLYNHGTTHNYSIAWIISSMRNHTSLRTIGTRQVKDVGFVWNVRMYATNKRILCTLHAIYIYNKQYNNTSTVVTASHLNAENFCK